MQVHYLDVPTPSNSLEASFQENVENQLFHTRGLALYFPGIDGGLGSISLSYKAVDF